VVRAAGTGVRAGDVAASGDLRPALVAERRRLDRLLGLWEYLVDPRVGVIREVHELRRDDDEPDFFHYLSTACDTARFTALSNFGNNGGVSTNRYTAIAKAMGESIERYCSAVFDYRDLVYDSASGLGDIAAPPEAFALYLPEQFEHDGLPWAPFTPDAPLAWTGGKSLVTGRDVMVPASMVYVPFHYLSSRPDTPIVQPISTGLAAHCSYAEAALSGLCEVIERDAFTLTWQARLSRPRIALETLPESCVDILRRFYDAQLTVEVIDITTDIRIPTVLTIALGEATSSPAVAVAAAADPSPERALVKSLEELAHTRKFARQLMEYTPELPIDVEGGHPTVQTQKEHLRFYCPQHAKPYIEFAWASEEPRDFRALPDRTRPTPEEELAALVQEVAAAGLDVVVCDLTLPDVGALGVSVARAIVPGAHPLFMGHRNRARAGRRLYTVPQLLGGGLELGAPDNPYPHPFP
jgi:ribosomal protein S12 methylthiotransferase accessory factor